MAYGSSTYGGGTAQVPSLYVRTAADSVTPPTEAAARSFFFGARYGYERLGIATPARRSLVSRPVQVVFLEPPTPPQDAGTKVSIDLRTAADSTTTSDTVSRANSIFVRSVSDSAPATDADVRQTAFFRAAADTVAGIGDSVARLGIPFKRGPPDSTTTSDTATRTVIYARQPADGLTNTPATISTLPSYAWHVDASNAASDTGTNINDLAGSGIVSTLNNGGTRETYNGIPVWNLESGGAVVEASGTPYTLGQNYTVWAWVDWRDIDSDWRTLHRGGNDHWIIVESGSRRLGLYSNRNGGFRPSGYNIGVTGWQMVVAVGKAATPGSPLGVTEFYINGEYVGSADRVASGDTHQWLGFPGSQGAGRVAAAGTFATTAFTPAQVRDLFSRTSTKYGFVTSDTATRNTVYLRSAADSVPTPTDSAVRLFLPFRSAADAPSAPTDAATSLKLQVLAQVSDSAPAVDSASRGLLLPRTTADSISAPTDTAARYVFRARTGTDATTTTDAAVRQPIFYRTGVDSGPAADSAVKVTYYRGVAESVAGITDSAVRSAGIFARSLTENALSQPPTFIDGTIQANVQSIAADWTGTNKGTIVWDWDDRTTPRTTSGMGIEYSPDANNGYSGFWFLPSDFGNPNVSNMSVSTWNGSAIAHLQMRIARPPVGPHRYVFVIDRTAATPVKVWIDGVQQTVTVISGVQPTGNFTGTRIYYPGRGSGTYPGMTGYTSVPQAYPYAFTDVQAQAASVDVQDGATRQVVFPRTATDSAPASDAAVRTTSFKRSSGDNATINFTGDGARSVFFFDGDGSNRYLSVPDQGWVATDGTFNTVEGWFTSTNGGGAWSMLIGWNSYDLSIKNGRVGFNTGQSDYWASAAGAYTVGQRTHIVAAFSNGDPKLSRIWVNGVEVALSQVEGTTTGSRYTSGAARISSWVNDLNYYFQGNIEQVALYQGLLPLATIQSHANGTVDAAVRNAGVFSRALADTATPADSAVRSTVLPRTTAETTTTTDAATRFSLRFRTGSDYGPANDQKNWLSNPSFSLGSTDWSGGFSITGSSPYDGGNALTINAASYTYGLQDVRLPPGTWVFSAYVSATGFTSNNAGLIFETGFWNQGGAGISYTNDARVFSNATFTNTRFQATVTITGGPAYIRCLLTNQYGGSGVVGSITFDGVQVEAGSTATAFSNGTGTARAISGFRSATDATTTTDSIAGSFALHPRTGTDAPGLPADASVRATALMRRGGGELAFTPRRTAKILIVSNLNGYGNAGAYFTSLGYNVTFNTAATTLADCAGYDIIACDDAAWAVQKGTLLSQAYDAGYSIFSSGNDTGGGTIPQVTASIGKDGTQPYDVIPVGTQYASLGWTQVLGIDGDTGNLPTSLRPSAIPVAQMRFGNTTGFMAFIEEHATSGARWFHYQDIVNTATGGALTLLTRGIDWAASNNLGMDLVTHSGTIYYRSSKDLAAPEDTRNYGTLVQRPVHAVWATTGGGYIGDWSSAQRIGTRQASDSTTTTDAPTRFANYLRVTTDSTSTTDAASRYSFRSRTVADATTTTDAALQYSFRARSASEALATTDAAIRSAVYGRIPSDTAPASDADIRNTSFYRTATDTVTPTDSTTRYGSFSRTPSEALTSSTDEQNQLVNGGAEGALTGQVSGYYGASISRSTAQAHSGVASVQVVWNSSNAAYPQGIIWFPEGNAGIAAGTRVVQSAWFLGTSGTSYTIAGRPAGPGTGAYLSEGQGAVTFTGTGAWQFVSTLPWTFSQAYTPGVQITTPVTASTFTFWVDDVTIAVPQAARQVVLTRSATDSVTTTTDTAARALVEYRTSADSVSPTDAATRTRFEFRSATDATTTTDATSRSQVLGRTPTDATSTTDAATRSTVAARTASDPTTTSDVTTRSQVLAHAASDVTTTTDVATRALVEYRTSADSLTLSDAATRVDRTFRAATDSTTTSDAVARSQVLGRTPGDAGPASDSDVRQTGFYRSAADTLTTTDLATRAAGIFTRSASDATTTSDATTRSTLALRTAADTIATPTDGAVRTTSEHRQALDNAGETAPIQGRSLVKPVISPVFSTSGGVSISDAATIFVQRGRTAADTVTSSDSAARSAGIFTRTPSDATTTSDTTGGPHYAYRTAADSTTTADAATRAVAPYARSSVDSTTTSDSVARFSVGVHSTTDTVTTPTESASRVAVPFNRTAADTAPANDADVRQTGFFRSTAETLATTDAATRSAGIFIRSANDSPTTSDAATRYSFRARTTSDTATPSDAATRTADVFSRTTTDSTTTSDSAVRATVYVRSSADSTTTSDSASRYSSRTRSGADSVSTPTDAPTRSQVLAHAAADSIPLSDAATRVLIEFRTVSDTVTTSDAATRLFLPFRSSSDSTTTSDSSTRSGTFYRTPSDSAPATDSDVGARSFFRSATDVVTPSDAATRSAGIFTRSLADSPVTSDTAQRGVVFSRTSADSTTTSDSATRSASDFRASFDNAGAVEPVRVGSLVGRLIQPVFSSSGGNYVTDSASIFVQRARTSSESIPLTDSVVRQTVYLRSLSDATSTSDAANKKGFPFRTGTDSLTTTDSAARSLVLPRTSTDTVTSSDSATKAVTHPPVASDTVPTPTDSAARVVSEIRASSDSTSITDAANRVDSTFRTASDSTTTSDTVSRADKSLRTASDSITTSDSASRVDLLARTAGDSAPATDASTQQAPRFRTAADTVTPTDAATRTGTFARAVSDATTTADSAARSPIFFRASTDSTSTTDSALRQATLPRTVKDEAGPIEPITGGLVARPIHPVFSSLGTTLVSDSASGATLHSRTAADSATSSDAVSRTGTFTRSLAETTSLSEVANKGGYPFRTGTDSAPATDVATRGVVYLRSVSETVTPSDAITNVTSRFKTASDSTTTSDAAARASDVFARTPADSITTSDSASRFSSRSRTGADSTTTTDAANRVDSTFRTASDSATPADSVARATVYFRIPSDSSPATDADVRQTGFFRTAGDTVTPTEAATRSQVLARTPADSAPAADALASPRLVIRTASDSTTTSDTTQRQLVLPRTVKDEAGPIAPAQGSLVGRLIHPVFSTIGTTLVADSVTGATLHLRSSSDSTTTSDSATRSGTFARSLSESIPLSEQANKGGFPFRTGTDSAPAADAVTRFQALARSLADSTSTSDAATEHRLLPRTGADSTTPSDAATRQPIFYRTPSDSAPANDAGTRFGSRYRTTADVITPSDAATRTTLYIRSIGDSAPAAEAVVSPSTRFRTGADSTSTTDSASRFVLFPRAAQDDDTQPVVQPATLVQPIIRPLTTSGTPSRPYDSATIHNSAGRTPSDSAPAVDAVASPTLHLRTAAEGLPAPTDSVSRPTTYYRGVRDQANYIPPSSIGLVQPLIHTILPYSQGDANDDAARWVANYRRLSDDALTVGDGPTRAQVLGRTFAESAPASDGVTRQTIYVRSAADSAPATDATTRYAFHPRTSADSASTTDSATRQPIFGRTGSDAAAISAETVNGARTFFRTANETVTVTDSLTRAGTFGRTFADSAPAADAVARKVVAPRSLTESSTTSDSAVRSQSLGRTPSDSAPAADSDVRQPYFFRSTTDTVTPSDVATRSAGIFIRSAAESAPASDAATRYSFRSRTTADSTPASDSTTRFLATYRTATDQSDYTRIGPTGLVQPLVHPVAPYGVGLVDVASRVLVFGRTTSDSAPAADSLASPTSHSRTTADSAPAADVLSQAGVYYRWIRDQANYVPPSSTGLVQPLVHTVLPYNQGDANDDAARWVAYYRRLSDDAVLANDSATRYVFRARTGSDAAPASDAVASLALHFRVTGDTAPVSDTLASPTLHPRTTSDAAPATQTQTSLTLHFRTTSDSAPATQTQASQTYHYRGVSDPAPASDTGLGPAYHYRTAAETLLAPTDAAVRTSGIFSRTLADAAAASDAVRNQPPQHTSDSAGAVDSVTRFQILSRQVAETPVSIPGRATGLIQPIVHPVPADLPYFTTVDAVARVQNLFRRVGDDAVLGSDSVTSWVLHFRTSSDTAPVVEAPARQVLYYRALRDQANYIPPNTSGGLVQPLIHPVEPYYEGDANDDALRFVRYYRRLADDAVLANESVSSYVLHIRALTETITATDANSHLTTHVRSLADAAPATDQDVRQTYFYRGTADAVTPSDSVLRALTLWKRTAVDSLSIADNISAIPPGKANDSAPAVDSVSRTAGIFRRTAADSAPATDVASSLGVRGRTGSDTAPATDSVVRATAAPRTSADTATPADATRRVVAGFRVSADVLSTSDSNIRTSSYLRNPVDSTAVTDVVTRQGGIFTRFQVESVSGQDSLVTHSLLLAFCYHFLPVPTDLALRSTTAFRAAAETVTPADSPNYSRILARSAPDQVSTGDAVHRQTLLIRVNPRSASFISDAYDPPIDLGFRTLALYRAVGDVVTSNDQGLPVGAQHIRSLFDAVPPVVDTLVVHVLASRQSSDTAPVSERPLRWLLSIRNPSDVASAADSLLSPRFRAITTSDLLTTPLDSISRSFAGTRGGSDGASVTDTLARLLLASRTAPDAAPTVDSTLRTLLRLRGLLDTVPTPVDQGLRATGFFRVARDRIFTPIDSGWWLQSHKVTFGPPIANLTAISRTKISDEADDCGRTTISFTFDQPVDAWMVRVNSTGPYDGNQAAEWLSPRVGFGLQAFGRYPFGVAGPSGEWTIVGEATITSDALLHGVNDVMVYGRSLQGVWSFRGARPVPEPVGAE